MTPSRRLLWLIAVLVGMAIALHWFARLHDYFLGACGLLIFMSLCDFWTLKRAPALQIERKLQGVWPVNIWNQVSLNLRNIGAGRLHIDVIDDYPTHWQMQGLPYTTKIAMGAYTTLNYHVCPSERGNAHFGLCFIRARTFFGLWERVFRIGEESDVKVFPDFSKLMGNTLQATDRRAPSAGSIRKRRRGEGTDFRQLRDYRQGDSLRSIDWKATARYQKPITREYQEERDQQVVFLLDTGRRMLAQDGATSHFDHALHAILGLSFIAQKQGDAVGLMSFGREVRWLVPHKGRAGLDRILAGVYDLQAGEVAPDYCLAASALLAKLNKRAFIVLITNVRDEDNQDLRTACELLSTKHLVMCASLRENALDRSLQTAVVDFKQALRYGAIHHYLDKREEAIKRLGLRTNHLIDIAPENLSTALVNRYLDIKESGLL